MEYICEVREHQRVNHYSGETWTDTYVTHIFGRDDGSIWGIAYPMQGGTIKNERETHKTIEMFGETVEYAHAVEKRYVGVYTEGRSWMAVLQVAENCGLKEYGTDDAVEHALHRLGVMDIEFKFTRESRFREHVHVNKLPLPAKYTPQPEPMDLAPTSPRLHVNSMSDTLDKQGRCWFENEHNFKLAERTLWAKFPPKKSRRKIKAPTSVIYRTGRSMVHFEKSDKMGWYIEVIEPCKHSNTKSISFTAGNELKQLLSWLETITQPNNI